MYYCLRFLFFYKKDVFCSIYSSITTFINPLIVTGYLFKDSCLISSYKLHTPYLYKKYALNSLNKKDSNVHDGPMLYESKTER